MISNPTRPILLVEDNPMDIDLTIRAFRHNNLVNPVTVLRDGEEAIDYIEKITPETPTPILILLDLKLPKVHGLEVLKRIKQRKDLVTIPVVVLSSSSEDKDIQTAYQYGANSYITKPVEFDKFIEIARNIELYWVLLNTPAA